MSSHAHTSPRTLHLPTNTPAPTVAKGLRLSELKTGESARILRVNMADVGCRKRFAELGLAEGMKVTVASGGDSLMLIMGGNRLAVASRCAQDIVVVRVK